MTSRINKKVFGMIAVAIVAVISGLYVGKLFVDMSSVAPVASGMASDYHDSDDTVVALYERSKNGAAVSSFTNVELYEIAEYRLKTSAGFYREMHGNVVAKAAGINVNQVQSTYRLLKNGVFVVKKVSPSTSSMAPSVAFRLQYDTNTKQTVVNQTAEFTKKSLPIQAAFDESKNVSYAEEAFIKECYSKADGSPVISSLSETLMPYVISSLTCGGNAENFKKSAKANGDGTYSFTLKLDGEYLSFAGMVYDREINYCASVATFAGWKELEMKVTIDSSFNFKEVSYVETYRMKHNSTQVVSVVTNSFVDTFRYDNLPNVEEVL